MDHIISDKNLINAIEDAVKLHPNYLNYDAIQYREFLRSIHTTCRDKFNKHSWLNKIDSTIIRADSVKEVNNEEELISIYPEYLTQGGFKHMGTIHCNRIYKNAQGQWIEPKMEIDIFDNDLYTYKNIVYRVRYGKNGEFILKHGKADDAFKNRYEVGYLRNIFLETRIPITSVYFKDFVSAFEEVQIDVLCLPQGKEELRMGKRINPTKFSAREMERWCNDMYDNKLIGK